MKEKGEKGTGNGCRMEKQGSIVGWFAVGAGLGVHFFEFALEVFILTLKFHDLLLEVCHNFIKLTELVQNHWSRSVKGDL